MNDLHETVVARHKGSTVKTKSYSLIAQTELAGWQVDIGYAFKTTPILVFRSQEGLFALTPADPEFLQNLRSIRHRIICAPETADSAVKEKEPILLSPDAFTIPDNHEEIQRIWRDVVTLRTPNTQAEVITDDHEEGQDAE